MGKSLVRLMNEVRFLPTKGGLTKKQAIYRMWGFSEEDPPPQNILTSVFALQEMGLVFWNYFKNFNL
jgi:hypothetical protein